MLTFPNVVGYLRKAVDDDALRAAAAAILAETIKNGLMKRQAQKTTLRLSSLGSCRLEQWYAQHGGIDLPVDPIDMQLARFDEGGLNGAWAGALIAVAARADGWTVVLEETVEFAGVPGHIDLRMYRADGRSHVVEIKTNYESADIKNPEKQSRFQVWQGASYCHPDDETKASQTFSLVVVGPCVKKGLRAKQFHFEAAPFHRSVANDLLRLRAAFDDEPPAGDPAEPWRCFTCRASACPKNKNGAANAAELLFA